MLKTNFDKLTSWPIMTKNIEDLVISSSSPIGEFNSSIGRLVVFRYRVKTVKALKKATGEKNSAREVAASKYIRHLLRILAYPEAQVVNNKEPEQCVLSFQDVDFLADEDLNAFSVLFLENHDYLYREQSWEDIEEAESKKSVFTLGDVVHPQIDTEQNFEYLYRLLCIEEDEQNAKYESMTNRLGIGTMSSVLGNQFNAISSMGSTIDNALKGIESPLASTMDTSIISSFEPAKLTLPEMPDLLPSTDSVMRQITERNEREATRVKEQDTLNYQQAKSISELVGVSKDMSTYIQALNENQIQAAEENSDATEKSLRVSLLGNKVAKKGLNINYWVLFLTFITLIYSVWVNHESSKNTQSLDEHFKSLLTTISQSESSQSDLLRTLLEQQTLQTSLKQQNELLQLRVKELEEKTNMVEPLTIKNNDGDLNEM